MADAPAMEIVGPLSLGRVAVALMLTGFNVTHQDPETGWVSRWICGDEGAEEILIKGVR